MSNKPESTPAGEEPLANPTSPGGWLSRHPVLGRLRNHLLAGIIVTAPISITIWLSLKFITFVDSTVKPHIPPAYNPETYLPIPLPGLGLLIVIIALIGIGAVTTGLVGRVLIRTGERILNRMPVVRNIYHALKQIFETVLARKSQAFRQVVLIEYPRRGSWALGFATGTTMGEVQGTIEEEVVNVFLPTTPNPTSGYLLFLPKSEVTFLTMSVEDGIKMVISGGVVTPPDTRSEKEKKVAKIPCRPETPVAVEGGKRG